MPHHSDDELEDLRRMATERLKREQAANLEGSDEDPPERPKKEKKSLKKEISVGRLSKLQRRTIVKEEKEEDASEEEERKEKTENGNKPGKIKSEKKVIEKDKSESEEEEKEEKGTRKIDKKHKKSERIEKEEETKPEKKSKKGSEKEEDTSKSNKRSKKGSKKEEETTKKQDKKSKKGSEDEEPREKKAKKGTDKKEETKKLKAKKEREESDEEETEKPEKKGKKEIEKSSRALKRERSEERETKPKKSFLKSDVSDYEEELGKARKSKKTSDKRSEKSDNNNNSKKVKKEKKSRSRSRESERLNKFRSSHSPRKEGKPSSRSRSRTRKEKKKETRSESRPRNNKRDTSRSRPRKEEKKPTRRESRSPQRKEKRKEERSRKEKASRSKSRPKKEKVSRSKSRSKKEKASRSKSRSKKEKRSYRKAQTDDTTDKQKEEETTKQEGEETIKKEETDNEKPSSETVLPDTTTDSNSTSTTTNTSTTTTTSTLTAEEKRERKRTRKSGWDDRSHVQPLALAPAIPSPISAVQQLINAQLAARVQQTNAAQRMLAAQQEQAIRVAKAQKLILANSLLHATLQPVAVDPLLEQQQILERRVYVGSLPYELTEEHIRAPFASFGNILKIDMPREGTRSKGFCFVEYDSKEAADLALSSMNGFPLAGRPIRVGRPSSANAGVSPILPPTVASAGGPLLSAPTAAQFHPQHIQNLQRLAAAGLVPGASPAVAAAGQAALMQLAAQQNFTVPHVLPPIGLPQMGPTTVANRNRIYVGSVFWDLSSEHLKAVFEAFGKVVAVELIPNPETGKHKGYGFVEFATEKAAEDAIINMNGFELCGRQLKVGRAQYSVTARKPDGIEAPAILGAPAGLLPTPELAVEGASSPMQSDSLDSLEGAQPHIDRFALMKRLMESREGPQSQVVLMKNMITADEVDPGFEQEVREECEGFGPVLKVVVHVLPDKKSVHVLVHFKQAAHAVKARDNLHKRWFGGHIVHAEIYDQMKFNAGIYA